MPSILIIEDDVPNRLLMSLQVEDLDCTVLTADNGVQGIEMFRVGRPSVVLLDLNMPRLDGFGFLEQLRNQPVGQDTPVVVVTAMLLDRERLTRLQNLGVKRILEKGRYSEDDLLSAVRPFMGA